MADGIVYRSLEPENIFVIDTAWVLADCARAIKSFDLDRNAIEMQ